MGKRKASNSRQGRKRGNAQTLRPSSSGKGKKGKYSQKYFRGGRVM